MDKYTMKELPELKRPYEKLETYGEKALSDAELLAIIIRNGTKTETSVDVAERVLNECNMKCNGLSLNNISLSKLTEINGIGRVKAILLKAVFELASRINAETIDRPFLGKPENAGEFLIKEFINEKQEKLKVLGLNPKGKLIKLETIAIGGLNSVSMTPREIFRVPIECECYNIIIAHNHPSGDPTPSKEDIAFTEFFIEMGRVLRIEILDHIVVGGDSYISMRKNKLAKW